MTNIVIMAIMKQRIKNLLAKVGSREEVAIECGVEPIAVYRWAQNGSIPSKHLAGVLRVATRNNTGVTATSILEAHDPARPESSQEAS